MILPILTYPDARLGVVSEPVDEIRPEHLTLIENMRHTMMRAKGGVGLAAIQVGVPLRIIVVSVRFTGLPYFAMINPEVTWRSEIKDAAKETCLSVPDKHFTIRRPRDIRVAFLTRAGERVEIEASGLAARVVQHEVDHLDGIVLAHRLASTIPKG